MAKNGNGNGKVPMSGPQNDRVRQRANIDYPGTPIHKQECSYRTTGQKEERGPRVWHDVPGTPRFATPLPSATRGPINARATRKAKGLPGY